MTVLEYITKNAAALSKLKDREAVYKEISKHVDAPIEEYKHSVREMKFLYEVLKGIFNDGKMEEARELFKTLKLVVDEKLPNKGL